MLSAPVPVCFAKDSSWPNLPVYVPVIGPLSMAEIERIEVLGMRVVDQISQDVTGYHLGVSPVLLPSNNGAWDLDTSKVVFDDGSLGIVEVAEAYDTDHFEWPWLKPSTPWVFDIDYDHDELKTHPTFFLGYCLQCGASHDRLDFAKVQMSYQIKRREVKRAVAAQSVLAASVANKQWFRLTPGIQPHRATAHFRCTWELHAPVEKDDDTVTVTPWWFYTDEPSDPTAWQDGGAIGSGASSAGTHINYSTTPETSMTDHQLIAFGFCVETAGDCAMAMAEGSFEYF